MDSKTFKFGKIAIIGLPNTGKSSLINAILKQKVFAVSSKPQTTRNTSYGIYTDDDAQIVFIDTPGYHNSEKLLNKFFIKELNKALKKSKLIVFLISADENKADLNINKLLLDTLKKTNKKILFYVSKSDLLKDKNNFIETKRKYYGISETLYLLSIKDKDSIFKFIQTIKEYLEAGELYYDKDYLTDKSLKFLSSEIIREKIFRYTNDELPYSTAVEIIKYTEEASLHKIYVNIIVEKASQKAILIGKNATLLKKIGVEARKDIENLAQSKVYLELFIKVKKNWTTNKQYLKELDYDT